ncbi:MAG: acylphosphatase [Saprospiraceae bacterium]|nr:acylphosphatase [Saprospiraceae bacterium]
MNTTVCYKITIVGKVQGVAFRYYSQLKAKELGLCGTTENQMDGNVVTFIRGDQNQVSAFVDWCKLGSPASDVKQVMFQEVNEGERQEYKDFNILR